MEWVAASAPSSSANLGPGFDTLAVALDLYWDRVWARRSDTPGVRVVEVEGEWAGQSGGGATAARAVEALLELLGLEDAGVELRVEKGVPPGRGLGSSGASAAAAVVAASRALGVRPSASVLVEAAGRGEAAAAGSPHYDNVAASVLGGFVALARGLDESLRVTRVPVSGGMYFAVVTPMGRVPESKTMVMRSVLPESVGLGEAVANWSRLAVMVAALASGDLRLAGEMMSGDGIVEPRRSRFIECYGEARQAALEAGAYGFAISGPGPSMIALAGSRGQAERVVEAMLGSCRWSVEPLAGVATPAGGALESPGEGAESI